MILVMSVIITLAAAIQWIIIRRIPFRIVRILVQVPLGFLTFFLAWFIAVQLTGETRADIAQANAQADAATVLDFAIVEREEFLVSISATGTISPVRRVPLIFPLAGLPVERVEATVGMRVEADDVIATLDNSDLAQSVNNAQIAFDLQEAAFNALTMPPRPEEIAAAEAALQAAQSSFNAAASTAPSDEELEIARLQSEIARNQLWQAQLQRDAVSPPVPVTIPNLPPFPDIPDDGTLPDDIRDAAQDVLDNAEAGLQEGVNTIQGIVQGTNAQNAAQVEDARIQAEAGVEALEYGVGIADLNYESVLNRNADSGSIASANAQRIQAQIALDRLINGPTELELGQAVVELQLAELALEQARLSLDQTELRAPFAGVIAQNRLTSGELPPQDVAVLLVDDSSFFVDLRVDETDVVNVQVGQRVEFTVDALPDATITGEVSSIAYTPVPIDGLVVYNVRVDVDTTDAPLRTGMSVTGRIVVQERENVLVVPNTFVRFNRLTGDAFVNVRAASGEIEERQIVLGNRNETVSEVLAGLQDGEQIVLLEREQDTAGGLFG